jgi:hypothetical protein
VLDTENIFPVATTKLNVTVWLLAIMIYYITPQLLVGFGLYGLHEEIQMKDISMNEKARNFRKLPGGLLNPTMTVGHVCKLNFFSQSSVPQGDSHIRTMSDKNI